VEQKEIKNRQQVLDELKAVETLGGEGLMLRKPGSMYEGNRSSTLLKVKTFYDAEAVVTGYAEGKGRNKGVTGALKCKMESGKVWYRPCCPSQEYSFLSVADLQRRHRS
jgi:DNA ligase 1